MAAKMACWHLLAWPAEYEVVAAGVGLGPSAPPPAGGSPSAVPGCEGDDDDSVLHELGVVSEVVRVMSVVGRRLPPREGDGVAVCTCPRFTVIRLLGPVWGENRDVREVGKG